VGNLNKKLNIKILFSILLSLFMFSSVFYNNYVGNPITNEFITKDMSLSGIPEEIDNLWNKTWGLSKEESFNDLVCDDQGYIYVTGYTASYGSGSDDIILIKYDPNGNLIWNRTWGTNYLDRPESIAVDNESNIYITGYTKVPDAHIYDHQYMVILKYNSSGYKEFDMTVDFGSDQGQRGLGIEIDDDNNFYICGFSYIGSTDAREAVLMKFNSAGESQWNSTWGAGMSATVYGDDLVLDSNGNIYITGFKYAIGVGDMILVKFDSAGSTSWAEQWDGDGKDYGKDIVIDKEENYLYVAGYSQNAGMFIVKFDLDGNNIAEETGFGGNYPYATGDNVAAYKLNDTIRCNIEIDSNDNIYIPTFNSTYKDGTNDFILYKYDASLNQVWTKTWGGNKDDYGYGVRINPNYNQLIMIGKTHSFGNGSANGFIAGTSPTPPINGNSDFTSENGVINPSASGNETDPYIIEYWVIDAGGSGSGITIQNVDKYFRIENCTIYNSGNTVDVDSCIKLDNTTNGQISHNNLVNIGSGIYSVLLIDSNNTIINHNNATNNNNIGIVLISSNNNAIIYNNVSNNGQHGIYAKYSDLNNFSFNILQQNTLDGFLIEWSCDNNTIYNNTINNNPGNGIRIKFRSSSSNQFNNFSKNYVSNNQGTGIKLESSGNDNLIYFNYIVENNIQAEDNGLNNLWDIDTIGNYWSDYGGVDANDNGIGDSAYSISGSTGSNDNYPIWDDGYNLEPIFINGTATGVGAQNWTWAKSRTWCTGSGSYSEPYIIKNLEIDAGIVGTGIDILNSNVFFIIQNTTVYNTKSGSIGTDPFYHAGIRFYNVSNAQILNNNISNNRFSGIRLYYNCDNNTIKGNMANDNPDVGIILRNNCDNNTIHNNTANDNGQWGIELYINSDNNNLTENLVNSNDKVGIQINSGCDNNLIYENSLIDNVQVNGKDDGTNNQWDNGIIGNYWSDYDGVDANDNGIGDTPYIISGSASSQDNFPIWKD